MFYDKAMKLLASILMITLLATVVQPLAAQEANKKAEIQNIEILTAFLGVINKLMMARDVIDKHCPKAPPINYESLNMPAEAGMHIKNCKRQLKQKGVNTKGTKAMFLFVEKLVAFQHSPDRLTEEDLLFLNQVFGNNP